MRTTRPSCGSSASCPLHYSWQHFPWECKRDCHLLSALIGYWKEEQECMNLYPSLVKQYKCRQFAKARKCQCSCWFAFLTIHQRCVQGSPPSQYSCAHPPSLSSHTGTVLLALSSLHQAAWREVGVAWGPLDSVGGVSASTAHTVEQLGNDAHAAAPLLYAIHTNTYSKLLMNGL